MCTDTSHRFKIVTEVKENEEFKAEKGKHEIEREKATIADTESTAVFFRGRSHRFETYSSVKVNNKFAKKRWSYKRNGKRYKSNKIWKI